MSKMKRILNDLKEAKTLESCGIFIAFNEENMQTVHALIDGVEDTPYQGGFFYFTLVFPSNYPLSPPHVTLKTTGNGAVRFNPNLYSCGKVCLSILGTWSGPGWTPGLTLSSVLLSIQTLLCPEPMLNEPGYERHSNTAELKRYNTIIQHETLRVALVSNVKAILNGTSCLPADLHEHVLTSFSKHLSFVNKICCEYGPKLDKLTMSDPFGEERGCFSFRGILKEFQQLSGVISSASVLEKAKLDDSIEKKSEVIDLSEETEKEGGGDDNNDDDDEEPIPDELKCGVCFDILATPAVLECGHVFCYLCAMRWLGRNPICPTCRKNQLEVTKLRRIFTLDMICEREAKARNKSKGGDVSIVSSAKIENTEDGDDEEVFRSTYELWCARRDQGIALDNGKRLEEKKRKGTRGGMFYPGGGGGGGMMFGGGGDEYGDSYGEEDEDEQGGLSSYQGHGMMPYHHFQPQGSYFNYLGGAGNRLGASSDETVTDTAAVTTSTSVDDKDKREREKEARLKFLAKSSGGGSVSVTAAAHNTSTSLHHSPHSSATETKPAKFSSVAQTPAVQSSASLRYLSPEELDAERDKQVRAAELEKLKREKIAKENERKRLQKELEHDKEVRKKNAGVLPGSHDSLFSSRVSKPLGQDSVFNIKHVESSQKKQEASPDAVIDENNILQAARKIDFLLDIICKPFEEGKSSDKTACVSSISSAEDVDVALSLVLKIVSNVIENPEAEKYRSINTTGKMYKEKLARVLGVQRLLHALGFRKQGQGAEVNNIQLLGDPETKLLQAEDLCVLMETRDKIMSIIECRKLINSSS